MQIPGFVTTPPPAFTVGNYGAESPRREARGALQPAAAIYVDGRFVCNGEVTGNGFINCYPLGGGGGGGQRCRPTCGPCRPDPESRTGRSRFCLRANCDDYTRPC